jgi:hypothetical protein
MDNPSVKMGGTNDDNVGCEKKQWESKMRFSEKEECWRAFAWILQHV